MKSLVTCSLLVLFMNCSTLAFAIDRCCLQAERKAKSALYAFYGAIGQRDWKYVYNLSTEDFRDCTVVAILMLEGVTDNAQLSDVVRKSFDFGALASEIGYVDSSSGFTSEQVTTIAQQIPDKEEFVANALNTLPQEKINTLFRVPKLIVSIRIDSTRAVAVGKYEYVSYHRKRPDDPPEIVETPYTEEIYLKRLNEEWRIDSRLSMRRR